jgi:Icc protein
MPPDEPNWLSVYHYNNKKIKLSMFYHQSIVIAQITDTHIFADPSGKMLSCCTRESFDLVVKALDDLETQPDLLFVTGDLSQDETPQSYQYLHDRLTSLGIPYYYLPGNHDQPEIMTQVLSPTRQSFTLGNWHFILLDSRVSGQVGGQLTKETLVWLELELSNQANSFTVIAVHHHPVAINSEWMDQINLSNGQDLVSILNHYPQVRLVIFGHIHQEFDFYEGKIRYLGTPSTCVQFKPNHRELVLDSVAPGFRLITLNPDGSLSSEVKRV